MHEAKVSRVGGAFIDGLRLTWPLARFTATRTSITVSTAFGGRYVVSRADLKALRAAWKHFWPSLEIQHGSKDAPRELWFLPLSRGRLIRDLRELGYDVV